MIERYADSRITEIWSLMSKFKLWQVVELAVIHARVALGQIAGEIYSAIKEALEKNPIDIAFIDEQEKALQHDFNAFREERSRFLEERHKDELHRAMTTYDTEESAFVTMLRMSCAAVVSDAEILLEAIKQQAIKYRYTPMNARTHGQEAEVQSFGKRCLTWYCDIKTALDAIKSQMENLRFSKLSGAIGTNSGIEPELEEKALEFLGLKPWNGATQIMPRVLYAPLAGALADLVAVIDKVAIDIRLGARSGRPLWQEPFGKKQMGSSAMPHKKNTIAMEQNCGMGRMARSYALGLQANIQTWEERAIEQSCVERVFWPDLFHVTLRAIKNLTKVLDGLAVYPDNMMIEIIESRGCYASNEAKELLLKLGAPFGLTREEAYRMVQLACFNVFESREVVIKDLREHPPGSLEDADVSLQSVLEIMIERGIKVHTASIEFVILQSDLRISPQLEAGQSAVDGWNAKLREIFNPSFPDHWAQWKKIFKPSHIMANEAHLFRQAFGV